MERGFRCVGRDAAAVMHHRAAGGGQVGVHAASDRRGQRRAEQDAVGLARQHDRAARRVGIELHQQGIARVAAGEVQPRNPIAVRAERIEDVARAVDDADRRA